MFTISEENSSDRPIAVGRHALGGSRGEPHPCRAKKSLTPHRRQVHRHHRDGHLSGHRGRYPSRRGIGRDGVPAVPCAVNGRLRRAVIWSPATASPPSRVHRRSGQTGQPQGVAPTVVGPLKSRGTGILPVPLSVPVLTGCLQRACMLAGHLVAGDPPDKLGHRGR